MPKVTRTMLGLWALGVFAAPLAAQKSSSRFITVEEIERVGANVRTAYDAVLRLRPRWLNAPREIVALPGNSSNMQFARVHVYQDDQDMGEADYLKTIPADMVFSLQWFSTNEAGARFGPSAGPVIVVTFKVVKREPS